MIGNAVSIDQVSLNLSSRAAGEKDAFAAQFRSAMGQLGGGVSIITVGCDDDRSGLTSNSVTSLSTEPPSLLVCVNRQASSWPMFHRYRCFGVNVLAAEHRQIAETFSGKNGIKGNRRYAGSQWFELETGAPLLVGAIAAIDCAVEDIIDRYSHSIIIGRVKAISSNSGANGLIYWRGQYRAMSELLPNSP